MSNQVMTSNLQSSDLKKILDLVNLNPESSEISD